MRDERQTTNERTLKIELLSQWKLEAEFRNISNIFTFWQLLLLWIGVQRVKTAGVRVLTLTVVTR